MQNRTQWAGKRSICLTLTYFYCISVHRACLCNFFSGCKFLTMKNSMTKYTSLWSSIQLENGIFWILWTQSVTSTFITVKFLDFCDNWRRANCPGVAWCTGVCYFPLWKTTNDKLTNSEAKSRKIKLSVQTLWPLFAGFCAWFGYLVQIVGIPQKVGTHPKFFLIPSCFAPKTTQTTPQHEL